MHSDDTAMPTRLQKQVEFLDANPLIAVVGTAYDIIDKYGNYITTVTNPSSPSLCRSMLEDHGNCVCNHSALVRKSAFQQAGPYHQFMWPAEDYDIWLRISEFAGVTNLPESLVTYRFHFENVSVRRTYQQALAVAAAQETARRRRAGDHCFLSDSAELTWEKLNMDGVSDAKIFAATASLYSAYLGVSVRCRRHDVIARLFREVAAVAKTKEARLLYMRVLAFLVARLAGSSQYAQACKYVVWGLVKGPKRNLATVISRMAVQVLAETHPLEAMTRLEKPDNAQSDVRIDELDLTIDPETKTGTLTILGWSSKLVPYRSQVVTICGLPPVIKLHISRLPYYESTEKTGLFFRGFLFSCLLLEVPERLDKELVVLVDPRPDLTMEAPIASGQTPV
jgi:hypothetical protein